LGIVITKLQKTTKDYENMSVDKLIYKDLSYVLNGIVFQVFKYHGPGYREKTYCQSLGKLLKQNNISFEEQYKVPLTLYSEKLSNRYFDFIIDDKIVIEVKVGKRLYQKDFDQVTEYLKLSGYKLGLLVLFGSEKADIYRILNNI